MKFENAQVSNFEGAFRGLRNPLESWKKSDSYSGIISLNSDEKAADLAYLWIEYENKKRKEKGETLFDFNSDHYYDLEDDYIDWLYGEGTLDYSDYDDYAKVFFLGPIDLNLAQRMIKAGTSDRKFLRQIMVSVDITAPLYWWKEADTYKIGTTANSTSTMHKLSSTPITKECFEMDDYSSDLTLENNEHFLINKIWDSVINDCEALRQKYNETKDKRYWKELIRLLPEGWLQTRTWTGNYEILRNMYSQRKNHRLTEWHQFCEWVRTLPYSGELILYGLDY